jgi:hypothetical protein
MTSVVNRTTEELLGPPPPGSSPAMVKQLQRIQQKMAGDAEAMTAEASALRTADMYWVHRDMVDVAAAAAATLPECYVRPRRSASGIVSC